MVDNILGSDSWSNHSKDVGETYYRGNPCHFRQLMDPRPAGFTGFMGVARRDAHVDPPDGE